MSRRVKSLQLSQSRKPGFTLLELVIVLVVIAAIAAMVVPTLSFVRDQADSATAAATSHEILNNFEIFKSSTGQYPSRLDSLLNADGEFYSKMYGASDGTFPLGTISPGDFAASEYLGYFMQNGAGMAQVGQHVEDTEGDERDANSSTIPIDLGFTASFCTIDPESANPLYIAKVNRITLECYPNQTDPDNPVIPDGHYLVALGVSGSNSSVGSTMTTAPLAPEKTGVDPTDYDRYIVVFDVSAGADGRGKVKLKVVLDSQFELASKNLEVYKNTNPTDDEGVYVAPEE